MLPLALFMGMHKKELTNNVQTKVDLMPRPNDRKMSTQHIATLLGATCCARLATPVAARRVLLVQV